MHFSSALLLPHLNPITTSLRRRNLALYKLPPSLKGFRVAAVENKPSPSPLGSKSEPLKTLGADGEVDYGKGGVGGGGGVDLGWFPAFPHALTASMANFLFGYHIGVMNGPIEDIARELGFEGNSFLEGLVVSIFIVGAFIGSISSASLIDKLGCKRTLQIDTIPLILGALIRLPQQSIEVLWVLFVKLGHA